MITLKKQLDLQDEFLIYKISYDSETPNFVFKTSRFLLETALRLNRNGDDYLSTEWVFFDGSHKRCKEFKTITVSFYHPLLKKMMKILTMEAEGENTESFTIMWNLLNECLRKVGEEDSFSTLQAG